MPQLKYNINDGTLTPANAFTDTWTRRRGGEVVTVQPLTADAIRSLEANAKLWAWYRLIGDEQGYDSGYVHNYCKYHIGLPIMAEKDPARFDDLRRWLVNMHYEDRISNMSLITCTSQFSRRQMNEYMEQVQRHFAEQGIELN